MEIYDYSEQRDWESEIFAEIEQMTYAEIKEMYSMMESVKKKMEDQEKQRKDKWYENVILPVLKEFAEREGLRLEVEKEDGFYTATMRGEYSIDILQCCTGMWMALQLSDCIEIRQEPQCCLILIHKCDTLPQWFDAADV